MSSKKTILISYRLGYDALLYWDAILTSIKKEYPNFRIFTAFESLETKDKSVKTEKQLHGIKHYRNQGKTNASLFYFPLPFFLFKIFKYKPDIIILNEFNLNSFYVLFFKFALKNTKILLLVESDPFIGYEKKHSYIRTSLRRFITSKTDRILTNNTLGFNYLIKNISTKREKIIIKPYLVSEPPKAITNAKTTDKINFLYVGQIIERKGLIYVLKALSMLDKDIQNKIEFNIIGSGALREELENFKDQNNLHCVNFIGFIDYKDIGVYYSNADCFILNTLHDYRALVGFEALSSGCAIIGSKYDGARNEVIHEGKNGFIVDPKDIIEIKNAITKIISNENLRSEFKEYSRGLSKDFTVEAGAKNIVSVLDSL